MWCFSSAVRWFCEGRELHNSPDIQIWRDGDLHTLVISEAFEDDTGRYNCVASNSLGADNTSAEVYIEGQQQVVCRRGVLKVHIIINSVCQYYLQKKAEIFLLLPCRRIVVRLGHRGGGLTLPIWSHAAVRV